MCQLPTNHAHAHTPNGVNIWHGLKEHLESVAEQAKYFAEKFSAGDFGYYAGLWHDIGKINPEFQEYLRQCHLAELEQTKTPNKQKGPDHKGAGVLLSCQQKLHYLAFPIQGHHGGLPSQIMLLEKLNLLKNKSKRPEIPLVLQQATQLIATLMPSVDFNGTHSAIPLHEPLERDFFIRMVFSSLVDADFLDTEKHFNFHKSELRQTELTLSELWTRLEQAQQKLSGQKQDTVNVIRHQVYQDCIQSARLPQGFFRLTVPTGGGKTRSSLAFALQHALKHDLDRVIMVIPYTSIIDQTAKAYRDILGDDAVLEHHSGVAPTDPDENPSNRDIQARLAAENWDAPLIVTTTVQFFESLFANKTSKCRKLHNIVRSVVILDEVQTLPVKLQDAILDGLRQLVQYYQVTVVLCTATQPALENSPYLKDFSDIREIVTEPSHLFNQLKRVDYEIDLDTPVSWETIGKKMQAAEQVLCIVNTKTDALKLLETLPRKDTFHLSTLLCGAHRQDILSEVKSRLHNGEPCRLVSTQVVEAGVDLDFPFVLRAVGPLDRIVQAAGRCNREGKMENPGRVFVFNPAEGKLPKGEYKTGCDTAIGLLRQDKWTLHQPEIFKDYFNRLYGGVISTDGAGIQGLRKDLDYPEVANKFRMIDDDTVSVVVHYHAANTKVENLLVRLNQPGQNPKMTMRLLQPYIVNVRKYILKQYDRSGFAEEIFPGLWEWRGKYDPLLGLQPEMIDPEYLVV